MQKIVEYINGLSNIWQAFWAAALPVKIIIIGGILGLLGGGVVQSCANLSSSGDPNPATIEFQVRITDYTTGEAISNAKATIYLGQNGPLYAVSDDGGFIRFTTTAPQSTINARLIVESVGYKKIEQNITFKNTDQPHPVQLHAN